MTEIDPATIERAIKGDQQAFKRIYDCYALFVWKVAYQTASGDRGTAGEIVQDVFVRLHKSLRKFKGEARLSTWIYRVAYNAAMTGALRRQKRSKQEASLEDIGTPAGIDDRVADRDLMDKILATLSAEERFLLVAREVNGLSFEDLAAVTEKNEGALRTSLHRLKERIREEFAHAQQ